MMLGKKLIASAMVSGLLWTAGSAGRAAVASHPGLLLLAGQLRLSLGDREGGLSLMQQAVQQDEASEPAPTQLPVSAHATSAQCAVKPKVKRVLYAAAPAARPATAAMHPLPPDLARQLARRQRDLVRLSLDQAHVSRQVRVLVLERMRDLGQPPAVPVEPLRANP